MSLLSPEGRQRMLVILTVGALVISGGMAVRAVRVARELGAFTSLDRVRSVLVRRLNAQRPLVTPAASLDRLGTRGALDRRELASALEEEFTLVIPEPEADSWRTVQDVVNAVDGRARARALQGGALPFQP